MEGAASAPTEREAGLLRRRGWPEKWRGCGGEKVGGGGFHLSEAIEVVDRVDLSRKY